MANLEALWIARELQPERGDRARRQAHYTHARISACWVPVIRDRPEDADGRMDLDALARLRIAAASARSWRRRHDRRSAPSTRRRDRPAARAPARGCTPTPPTAATSVLAEASRPALAAARSPRGDADSIVIDPHKHGLQPYGCGCVLFRDPGVGRFYPHDSPYTYFSSAELHLGEISLECSRAGAAAAALWTTLRALRSRAPASAATSPARPAARATAAALDADPRTTVVLDPEVDIVCVPAFVGASAADAASGGASGRRGRRPRLSQPA